MDIEIPKFMDAYNQKILSKNPDRLASRLDGHWNLSPKRAADCIQCGSCESKCTQHLPIIERLQEIAAL
jgi:predicted aldo/keto reductase-like oxidoreductase